MSLEVCVLASGSRGNATYIASETTRILIDAGLSAKQMGLRLAEIGVTPDAIDGICISHEHGDHIAGIRVLQNKHDMPIYANHGTLDCILRKPKHDNIAAKKFTTGSPFQIGDLTVDPFSIPHDAFEPVAFRVTHQDTSVAVVTDLGMVTSLVKTKLQGCHAVVIEANHDEDLLQESERPWTLKQRIRGRQGHLSNVAAAQLIADIAHDGLEHIYLSHLSSDCNTPEMAHETISSILRSHGLGHLSLEVSHQHCISRLWRRKEIVHDQ